MKPEVNLKISKRNRRGIVILSLLLLGIIYFPRAYFYFQPHETLSIQSFPSEKWENHYKDKSVYPTYSKRHFQSSLKKKFSLPKKKFDPNTYSKEEWMKLGLSSKQAEVILKFRQKGIYSNQDLKKIFVISAEFFDLIKDSTIYPVKNNKFSAKEVSSVEPIKKPVNLLDINTASEEDLLEIKGVGPFFAKQIIKKRNELGGFVDKRQLLEVWKMDNDKFQIIENQIVVEVKNITKIHLNSVTIEQLKAHPYVRWNLANSIIKMRDQHNGFKTIDEIKESVLITDEIFEKLKPYLSL